MEVNEILVRRTVAHLARYPDLWDQNVLYSKYSGARCFAGWAVGGALWTILRKPEPIPVLYTEARHLLGFSTPQGRSIFKYLAEPDGSHPTLPQFLERVTEVTGIEFQPVLSR